MTTVRQVVSHWQWQHAENPLWSDEEREAISRLVSLIEGKNKPGALAALEGQSSSQHAALARLFLKNFSEGLPD